MEPMSPPSTDLCDGCLDGRCAFCLLGWPGDPAECGCHAVRTIEGPPCPRCGNATRGVAIVTGEATFLVGYCVDPLCGWEKQGTG